MWYWCIESNMCNSGILADEVIKGRNFFVETVLGENGMHICDDARSQ